MKGKNIALSFFGFILLAGAALSYAQSQGITNAEQVKKGMTVAEVAALMGPNVVIGYQKNPKAAESFDPMTVNNPQRQEELKGSNRAFQVIYYITDVKKADDKITDDELTPFVFEKDRFIGKGWSFLGTLIAKYKLN